MSHRGDRFEWRIGGRDREGHRVGWLMVNRRQVVRVVKHSHYHYVAHLPGLVKHYRVPAQRALDEIEEDYRNIRYPAG